MGDITDAANATWRDYETDGVPSSGEHEPLKSDIRATFALVEDIVDAALEVINDGLDPGFPYDVSRDVGTTAIRLLPADPHRIALSLVNVDLDGGSITFTRNGQVPVAGAPGTITMAPGDGYSWGVADAPKGEIWVVADAEGTALTADYASSVYNSPSLLELLDAFEVSADDTREGLIRTLFAACATAHIAIDDMEHFAAIGATEQATLLNWPDAGVMVNHGATFDADDFVQGDGVGDYVATGVFLPRGDFALQDAFMAVWCDGTTASATARILGANLADIRPKSSSTNAVFVANAGGSDAVNVGAHDGGFFCWVRTEPDTYDVWYNGAFVSTVTRDATTNATARELLILAGNSTGSPANFSDFKWFFSAAGKAPRSPSTAIPALYAAVSAYLTAIGAI